MHETTVSLCLSVFTQQILLYMLLNLSLKACLLCGPQCVPNFETDPQLPGGLSTPDRENTIQLLTQHDTKTIQQSYWQSTTQRIYNTATDCMTEGIYNCWWNKTGHTVQNIATDSAHIQTTRE